MNKDLQDSFLHHKLVLDLHYATCPKLHTALLVKFLHHCGPYQIKMLLQILWTSQIGEGMLLSPLFSHNSLNPMDLYLENYLYLLHYFSSILLHFHFSRISKRFQFGEGTLSLLFYPSPSFTTPFEKCSSHHPTPWHHLPQPC